MLRMLLVSSLLVSFCGCVMYEGYYYTSYDPYYPRTYTTVNYKSYVYTEPTVVYYDRYWYYPHWTLGACWVWTPSYECHHHYDGCYRYGV